MWKLHREEWKLGQTSPGIHGKKKFSRLLKVAGRLETKPKLKFSVEDESSVMTNEGEESDDS